MSELSRLVALAATANGPVNLDIQADGGECEALARRFGIVRVNSLRAQVRVAPVRGRGVLRVRGPLQARVTQTCVVTLEPFEDTVSEEIDLLFAPADAGETGREVVVGPPDEDVPEPLEGDMLDAGEVVAQALALALDPYPRRPNAGNDVLTMVETESEHADGPFAVLGQLKSRL